MKNLLIIIVRIIAAVILSYIGYTFLYPHFLFPIEKFEYRLRLFSGFNWLMIPFIARLIVSLFFIMAFLLLFYWPKIKWVRFLAPLTVAIPFLINPVLPKDFKDEVPVLSENVNENFAELVQTSDRYLIAYLSAGCLYCRNAAKKIYVASLTSKTFPEVLVVSTSESIEELFAKTDTRFPYTLIDKDLFSELTEYQYPKIHLIENGKVVKKYNGYTFNYRVLANLSKKN
jgi:thioredoxin-related protein